MTQEEREYSEFVIRSFRSMAPIYDWMTIPIRRLREQAVDLAAAPPGATVLDVATGTGDQALAFARRGYRVTAFDLTDAMLDRATRKRDADKVQFELGDATRMRFPSRSFDVGTVSFALHDMLPSIRERVLREMRRVVKPGGTILIVDYGLPRNPVGRALVYRLICLYEGDTYREFVNADLRTLLSRVGISVMEEQAGVLGAARLWKATPRGMPQ